ncbi:MULTISPECIES: IS200/IS605 family transposase [Vibrio]|uniref:IS200/IS605 family transposase n=1 Tax=Vibrio TaxID=662 RepID=UPI0012AE7346|nr:MULTISPECIES: IS200/IS605 family transposase [Vibrio]NNN49761.1 IS200/IS605 family transposase [Vibrio sp. 2-2(8)]
MLKRSDYEAYDHHYHFTASTKYRKPVFDENIRKRLEELLKEKSEGIDGQVLSVAAAVNHVHLLIRCEQDISYMANMILGPTSRLIRKEFPQLKELHEKQLWGGKACTSIKDQSHLTNARAYIDRHDPLDSRVD